MRHKIVLSELDKYLFPEYYPYFNRDFQADLKELKQENEFFDQAYANILFKIRVIKLSQKLSTKELRQGLCQLFNMHVDYFFDWNRSYDWHELKSVLFFFLIFSDVKTFRDFEKAAKKTHNQILLRKYLLKDQAEQAPLYNISNVETP